MVRVPIFACTHVLTAWRVFQFSGPYGTNTHWAPKTPTKVGDRIPGTSITLPGGKAYNVSLFLQASPCGTSVTLMGGTWRVTNVVLREASEDVQGVYEGVQLATAAVPCGNEWTQLEATVRLPPANATVNGTALQLQLAALPNERQWGATVWIGAASVVEVQ
jgi:hypothetical protein